MAAAIKYLLENSNAHDFHFIVGPQKQRVGAVRTLLAKCSEHLYSLLLSKEPDNITKTEDIPDCHVDAVNILLKYAYGAADSVTLRGELTGWSRETALHVVYLADKYLVLPLKETALAQLVPTGVDDLFPALHCVTNFDAKILETPVLEIVQTETEKVLAHPDFVKIDVNSLTFILKQDILRVQDLELWKATLAWAKNQEGTEDPATLRELMLKPLRHIRLYTFTRQEFWQHVVPSQIFSPHELVEYIREVDNQSFNAIELFDNSIEKRLIFVDLKTHNEELLNERVSECRIKLEKNAKLSSVVCHGRSGSSEFYTTTVIIRLYCDVELQLAMSKQTVKCKYNEDVVLAPLGDVGDVSLSSGRVYTLYVQFSEPQPTMASVKGDSSFCDGHQFVNGRLDCVKYNGNRPYSTHFKGIVFSYLE